MSDGIIFDTPKFNVYEQMAADEILCDEKPAEYILRFYNWASNGITFGYSQRFNQVNNAIEIVAPDISEITRRPTGGGIVFHTDDITFSFIFPSPEILFEPHKVYNRLHAAINNKYKFYGEDFSLVGEQTKDYSVNSPAMNCFSKPVNMDILYNGKKVLGGALRKFGIRMLYQASFQAPEARKRADFHRKVLTEALSEEFNISWKSSQFSEDFLKKTEILASEKYNSDAWKKRI